MGFCLDDQFHYRESFVINNLQLRFFFSFWEINDVLASPNINEPQGH